MEITPSLELSRQLGAEEDWEAALRRGLEGQEVEGLRLVWGYRGKETPAVLPSAFHSRLASVAEVAERQTLVATRGLDLGVALLQLKGRHMVEDRVVVV